MKKNEIFKLIIMVVNISVVLSGCSSTEYKNVEKIYGEDSIEKELCDYVYISNVLNKLKINEISNAKLLVDMELDDSENIYNNIVMYKELISLNNLTYEQNNTCLYLKNYLFTQNQIINDFLNNDGYDITYNNALESIKVFYKEYYGIKEDFNVSLNQNYDSINVNIQTDSLKYYDVYTDININPIINDLYNNDVVSENNEYNLKLNNYIINTLNDSAILIDYVENKELYKEKNIKKINKKN